MSSPAKKSRGSDSNAVGRIAEAVRQYESAWQRTLTGEPPPAIDLFVAAAEEADRDLLRESLSQFEHQWRHRHEQATMDPIPPAAATGDTHPGGATIELPPQQVSSEETAPAAPDEAHDRESLSQAPLAATLPPSLSAPPGAGSDATLDLPAGGRPPVSMAPAAGADAATGVWDPNSVSQQANPNLAFTVDAAASTRRAKAESSRPSVPDYELLSELGRGGMGIVYKAVHTKLHRVVALKMVLAGAHASPDQLARFATEAEAVAALQHPNIVQIYEIGEQNGLPFFSLEFVDGQPLDKRLAGKPQPPLLAAKLMEPIARAMHFAHEHGIVHRDLKPANVLLTRDGVPKVTDFGLAKKLESDSSQTKEGTLMGTPSYMAPEQARGEIHLAGPPADIHSLGAMLYEMLVGRPPYLGATPLETMMQVTSTEPVPPRKLMPKLSRDVETICLKCLQKEPSRRYANAGELADDLARFERGEPIQARPISKPERAWRWCRRNPRVALLSTAVFLLLAMASVAMGKLAVNASQQRQASEETRKLAGQRLEEATQAVAAGSFRRAADLLRGRDARLSTAPDLADVRQQWQSLQNQVAVYAEFHRLSDESHFLGLTGNRENQLQARKTLQELLKLYEEIRDGIGRAADGLPPLDARQRDLFVEDEFEALYLAALMEWDVSSQAEPDERAESLKRGIEWMAEAERLLPNTRNLYVRRSAFWAALGEQEQADADIKRADSIEPTLAVDHFWRGYTDYMRGDGAGARGEMAEAADFYHRAIREYAAVLRLNARHYWAFTQWAACHFQLGNFADALVGFSSAIDINPDHPWPYTNRGVTQMKLGHFDEAILDFNLALERDGTFAQAYYNRALAQLNLNKNDVALADLDHALDLKKDDADAWFQRAETDRRLKHTDEALADYGKAIDHSPNPVRALLRRAEFYRELTRNDDALADYDAALRHRPDNLDARRCRLELLTVLGRNEAAIDDLDELIRANANDVDAYARRANLNRTLKRNEAAVADYTRLIELGHDLASAYRARAEIHAQLGQATEAIADYGELLKLKPDDVNSLFQKAALEFNGGRQAEARDDFSAVIRLAPKAPQPYRARAFLNLVVFKELDASLADWQTLAELVPGDAESRYYVGAIQMGRRQYAAAVAALDDAVRLKSDYVEAHWARAQTFLFQKRYDESLAEIGLLIEKLATNRPATFNSRGDAYRAMGRLDEAAADYRTLLDRTPAQPDPEYTQAAINAWLSLAGVLDAQGKSVEARACFDDLVAANPTSVMALLERANYHRAGGRFDAALADCEAAVEIDAKSLLPALARAGTVAARGDHVAAVAAAENLLAAAPSADGHVSWAAARVWSLACAAAQAEENGSDARVLAQAYAERAADLLTETLGRGFHDLLYPEHNRLPIDPALAAIRRQPRVRELLGE